MKVHEEDKRYHTSFDLENKFDIKEIIRKIVKRIPIFDRIENDENVYLAVVKNENKVWMSNFIKHSSFTLIEKNYTKADYIKADKEGQRAMAKEIVKNWKEI